MRNKLSLPAASENAGDSKNKGIDQQQQRQHVRRHEQGVKKDGNYLS